MQLSNYHRLETKDVERLHAVVGGDPFTERLVLGFIAARWQARNLFFIPVNVASEILNRPQDFIRAAKKYPETSLPF